MVSHPGSAPTPGFELPQVFPEVTLDPSLAGARGITESCDEMRTSGILTRTCQAAFDCFPHRTNQGATVISDL